MRKRTRYDNAVAEATFKIIKTEFVRRRSFESLDELDKNYQHTFIDSITNAFIRT